MGSLPRCSLTAEGTGQGNEDNGFMVSDLKAYTCLIALGHSDNDGQSMRNS